MHTISVTTRELPSINERRRLPSPAITPQALAWHSNTLWMGSRDLRRIYAIDVKPWTVVQETEAPGIPWAAVSMGRFFALRSVKIRTMIDIFAVTLRRAGSTEIESRARSSLGHTSASTTIISTLVSGTSIAFSNSMRAGTFCASLMSAPKSAAMCSSMD